MSILFKLPPKLVASLFGLILGVPVTYNAISSEIGKIALQQVNCKHTVERTLLVGLQEKDFSVFSHADSMMKKCYENVDRNKSSVKLLQETRDLMEPFD